MRARQIGAATLRAAVFAGLAAVTVGGLGLVGARVTASQGELAYTPQHATPAADAASATDRSPRPGTFVVAVVLGTSATVATDAMGPYEVFAVLGLHRRFRRRTRSRPRSASDRA